MRCAICGYPLLVQDFQDALKDSDIDFKAFIADFVSTREDNGEFTTDLPLITFFEFRRLIRAGEIDGLIVVEDGHKSFTKSVVQICKFYQIPNLGIVNLSNRKEIYWTDVEKNFFAYMEVNLVDGCNLNCKACAHFSNLFKTNEI